MVVWDRSITVLRRNASRKKINAAIIALCFGAHEFEKSQMYLTDMFTEVIYL